MKIEINRVMLADSYKYSHASQYPNMISMYDYMEARSDKHYPEVVFVGLQGILQEYFTTPIKQWEVDEAFEMAQMHGVPFDKAGWDYIVQKLDGNIPVVIKAVPEGTVMPVKTVLMTVESTDPKVPWIAGWLETILMKVWYPSTVATKAYFVRKMLEKFGSPEWAQFAYHNFGDRGSSSVETAAIGGYAHLAAGFMGTDNFNSLRYIRNNYGSKCAAFSVFATEHSTTTANAMGSKIKELQFVERMLIENPEKAIMSFVADSYNIYNFTDMVTRPGGRIRTIIDERENQKFVIRPDSGDALEVIAEMLKIMEANGVFDIEIGGRKSSSKWGILWGDGITPKTIEDILTMAMEMGYAAETFVFGSGGDIMQNVNRDTLGFAVKCSSITRPDGTEQDVFKDPITASNKKSKKGRVTTYKRPDDTFFVDTIGVIGENAVVALETIYKNGKMVKTYTIDEIRERCK